MALTVIGDSAVVSAFQIAQGAYIDIDFAPLTTFAENDVLVVAVSGGAADASSAFDAVSPGDLTFTSGWASDGVFSQNSPYWWILSHKVTAGEAGAGHITCRVTLASVGAVAGTDPGYLFAAGGVGVRGSDGTPTHTYVPTDSSDTDNVAFLGGSSSPISGTWPVTTPYWTGTAGTLLYYVSARRLSTTTAASATWTGPTENADFFGQDQVETGANDADFFFTSGYELLEGEDWPDDTLDVSYTGTKPTEYAARAVYVFDAIVVVYDTPPPPYQVTSRRVTTRELPHEVTSRMFDDL